MAAKVLILIAFCMQGVVARESVFLNLNATISVKSSSAPGELVFTITTSDEMFHPSDIILKTDSKYFETYPMDPRKIVVRSCLPAGITEVLEFSLADGNHDLNDNNILTINILPVTPIFSIPSHIVVPVDLIPYEIPGIIEVHQITFSNAGVCTSFRCNVTSTNDEKHFWIDADTNSIRTFVRDLVYDFPYKLEITCIDASGVDFTPASISEINIEAIFTDKFHPGANDSLAASNAEGVLHFQTQLENTGGDRYIDEYERSEEERSVDLAVFDTFDFNGEILGRQKRDVTTSAPASSVAYNVVSTKRRCLCSNNFHRPGPNGFFIRKYRPVKVTQVTFLTTGTTSITSTFTSNVTSAIDLTQSLRNATADNIGLSNLPTTNIVSSPTVVPSTEEVTPTSGDDSQLSSTNNSPTIAKITSDGSKTTDTTHPTTSSDSLTIYVTQATTSNRRQSTHILTSKSTLLTSTEPTATETTYLTTANTPLKSESTQQPTSHVLTTTDHAESTTTADYLTALTTKTSTLTVTTVAATSEETELSTSTVVSTAATTELTSTDEPASLSTTKLTTTGSPSAIDTTQSAGEVDILPVTTTQQSTAIVEEATHSSSIQTTNGGSITSTKTTVSQATRGSSSVSATETPTPDQQQTGPTLSHTHQTPTNQPGTTNILHAETPGPGFFGDWTNLCTIIGGSGGIALVGIIGTVIYKVFMVQQCRSLSSVGTNSIRDAGNAQYNTEPVYSGDATSSTVALVPNEEGLTPVGS